MDKLRVGYVCLARLTFDGEYAREVMQRTRAALAGMENVELVCPDDLAVEEEDAEAAAELFNREKVDVVVVQYGTFSLGSLMPLFADRLSVPIVVWGVPEPSFGGKLRINSLCGVNMNAHTLMRLGRKYETLFCNPEEGPAELDRLFRVLHCLRRLRHVRLGLVGYRVPGFYTSNCDELDLRRRMGVELHHITLAEVYEEAAKTDPDARKQVIESVRACACKVDATAEELDKAAALYLALKELAARYRLDSLAVKCWPEFPNSYGVVACWAVSRLNDEGILTSCEGDVYGAVMMLMAKYLTGKTPMFADFVAIDEPKNLGIGWHCGAAPTCMSADPKQVAVGKHPTARGGNLGVAVSFPIAGGMPATMTRLGMGPNGLRLFFAGGESVDTGPVLQGNPAGIRFDAPARQVLKTILDNGVEHHFVIVPADLRPELRIVAKWLDLPAIDVDGK